MKRFALASLCLVVATACVESAEPKFVPPLTEAELAEGWISLFDGKTLYGWRPAVKANWRVADGAIVVDEGEVGLLTTTTEFGDYVLRLEFKSPPSTNSGIFLHTPPRPTNPTADCYELNIAGEGVSPYTTGGLVGRAKAAALFSSDDWQTLEVIVQGAKISAKINGRPALEYVDPHPLARGRIGLQHNQGKVAFRRIKLKPLGTRPIFNGKDLTGWNAEFQGESKFTVNEAGELNVRNGKGQLETQGEYGDFVLQLECISHAANLNSGVFFRCIPHEAMNGYESQIHNGFQNGDRAQPVDCGTGGIFRRQNARLVAADDGQWFTKTIIADGPHMAVWVNGLQVTDWTDDRSADANPRRGLRLAPGTIQLQGHDPTTNLSFRNLRIGKTAARAKR